MQSPMINIKLFSHEEEIYLHTALFIIIGYLQIIKPQISRGNY